MSNGITDAKPVSGVKLRTDLHDPDPVVHEIPIFISNSLSKQLYMLQFPVRPSTMPYNSSYIKAARLKPNQKQIEMEFALDTRSNNFNKSKAEQIATNVDGKPHKRQATEDKGAELVFPSGMMDKQLMVSSKAVCDTGRYGIGILSNQELHITPLESVLTMRSCLKHLDVSDKKKKDTAKTETSTESLSSNSQGEDEGSDLMPVTVRFAKTGVDREKHAKAREQSFLYQQQKAKEEQWVNLKFHNIKSPKWLDESRKLFCRHMDAEIQNLASSTDTFLYQLK